MIPRYRTLKLKLPKYRVKKSPIPQYRKPPCPPPQEMKDKNAFILSIEIRAFIIVMTFVAVSDTIGRVRLRVTELLVRDLIMPFWALLFVKN